jgi:hypothetical protein
MDQLAKTIASYGLWALILVTCPVLFVVAFLIWLVTFPFDRRLRFLHLYSCWWASIYTYVFPYWRTSVRNRERLRSDTRLRRGLESPVAARHPGAVPAVPALQVGLEGGDLPAAVHRLEHVAEPLHPHPARRPKDACA